MASEKRRVRLPRSTNDPNLTVSGIEIGVPHSNYIASPEIPIRQVCDELGATLRALRFYEGRGLVAPRRHNTQRFYSTQDVERLRTILKLKSFGLSLREIRELLRSPGDGPYGLTAQLCKTLIDRLSAQKAVVDTALEELEIVSLSALSRAVELAHQETTIT